MKRHTFAAVLALLVVAPLAGQSPQGWRVRLDRSTSASDPDAAGAVRFVVAERGFLATNPVAAVFWNPANTTSGTYSLKGTFTLMRPSGHVNYYGLVFGGRALEGPDQNYLYFMVAQDGTWIVKRRNRGATEELSPKTPNDAVRKPDASGKSTNALEVRVASDTIDFLVNGTIVDTKPKTGRLATTDGIYGIRVNHLLEVQMDGFGASTP